MEVVEIEANLDASPAPAAPSTEQHRPPHQLNGAFPHEMIQ